MIISANIPKVKSSKEKITIQCDECETVYERRYDYHLISIEKHGCCLCKLCADLQAAKRKTGSDIPANVKLEFTCSKCGENYFKTAYRHKDSLKRHNGQCVCPKCSHKRKPNDWVNFNCANCNKPFSVCYARRNKAKYCSRECQISCWSAAPKTRVPRGPNKFRKPPKGKSIFEKNCHQCEIYYKTTNKKSKFCSRTCCNKHLSETRKGGNNPAYKPDKEIHKNCEQCHKPFTYTRKGLAAGMERFFCSVECSREAGRNQDAKIKKERYPIGWKAMKREIKQRDNHQCILCQNTRENKTLHVHHINYNKQDISPGNLVTLCQSCHNMTHSGRETWELIFNLIFLGCAPELTNYGLKIGENYKILFKEYKEIVFEMAEKFTCLFGRFNLNGKKVLENDEIEPFAPTNIKIKNNTILRSF